MPKEKNKPLNPYYLELLKFLVVYKFKSRIGVELSLDDRNQLAAELKEYNTPDSLNRIFSFGEKRRQNFNHSNMLGLCNYVGFTSWEHFLKAEFKEWATSIDGIHFSDLKDETIDKINKTIFIRILQEIEGKIIGGITEYFKQYINKLNGGLETADLQSKIQGVMRMFNICVDYLVNKTNEAHLMIVYKVAENIDEKKNCFEGFTLPPVFIGELFRKISKSEKKTAVEKLIEKIDNPLEKEVLRLYKEG